MFASSSKIYLHLKGTFLLNQSQLINFYQYSSSVFSKKTVYRTNIFFNDYEYLIKGCISKYLIQGFPTFLLIKLKNPFFVKVKTKKEFSI